MPGVCGRVHSEVEDLYERGAGLMNDSISRQNALTEIRKDGKWLEEQGVTSMTTHERELRDTFILREMPSAQKKGHWVQNDNGTWSCSNCQSWIPNEQHYYARFCLHCGADMREEATE